MYTKGSQLRLPKEREMKYNLTPNHLYRVKHKDINEKLSNKTKRIFLKTEMRFENILCYVFTTRVLTNRHCLKCVSIPEYCLVSVEDTVK